MRGESQATRRMRFQIAPLQAPLDCRGADLNLLENQLGKSESYLKSIVLGADSGMVRCWRKGHQNRSRYFSQARRQQNTLTLVTFGSVSPGGNPQILGISTLQCARKGRAVWLPPTHPRF